MTPRRDNFPSPHPPGSVLTLPVLEPNAAAVDVGADKHWVCVPADRATEPAQSFGTMTCDLERLADWLTACGVTSVALESTGVYWIPLFELLERRGFQVFLCDPHRSKNLPGRPKTDRLDCQWLQRLHSLGLLNSAFRPPDDILVLRGYLRQRQTVLAEAARHVQHIQKALEQMNLKLPEVVSDIMGKTGLSILKAIVAGERDPQKLAAFRQVQCRSNEARIAQALQGNWRAEHLFALKQALASWEWCQQQWAECDREMEAYLKQLPARSEGTPLPSPSKSTSRGGNAPAYDARGLLYQMSGVDLTAIEGIGPGTALVILAEVGPDLSRFATAKHFCSWLGLCPQVRQSGRYLRGARRRPGTNRVAQALRMAAQALHRSQSALGDYFRRHKSRHGAAQAIVNTAHKLARLVYALLKHGSAYVAESQAEESARYEARRRRQLEKQARELGYDLVPHATPASATPATV